MDIKSLDPGDPVDDWNSPTEMARRNRYEYRARMHSSSSPDPSRWIRWTAPVYLALSDPPGWIENLCPDWFRLRFIVKYRHVPLPDLGWADIDVRMFHACFVLLGQYVERELGREPSDRVKAKHNRLWGYDTSYYRGYRLHACGGEDETAIDLWLWYSVERPRLHAEEARLLRLVYGEIDGSKPVLFPTKDRPREPDEIRARRRRYRADYNEFCRINYGVRPIRADGFAEGECTDDALDARKLVELMSLRRSLWT